MIFLLPNISIYAGRTRPRTLPGVSRRFHTKKALTFTSTFSSTQCKPTASTPLPSLSVRTPVTAEAPRNTRRPSTDWTLSFGPIAEDLVSNGSHGAQRNFQIGLTSPLNDQRATKGGACVISCSHIEVYTQSSYLQSKAGLAHTHKVVFTHRGRLISSLFSALWSAFERSNLNNSILKFKRNVE